MIPALLAQSLVEYSLVASISQTFQRGRSALESWVASLSATEWAFIAGGVLLLYTFRSLRSR
jgi:hypothetical protein